MNICLDDGDNPSNCDPQTCEQHGRFTLTDGNYSNWYTLFDFAKSHIFTVLRTEAMVNMLGALCGAMVNKCGALRWGLAVSDWEQDTIPLMLWEGSSSIDSQGGLIVAEACYY